MVIKLDMAKSHDSVSWNYLMHELRTMGFAEHFINMVWQIVSTNWYSVLLSGQAARFFHCTRGLKQGDPLSLILFFLSTKVLPRYLDKLFEDISFTGYGIPKRTDPLNHQAYNVDSIIFASI